MRQVHPISPTTGRYARGFIALFDGLADPDWLKVDIGRSPILTVANENEFLTPHTGGVKRTVKTYALRLLRAGWRVATDGAV